MMVCMAKIKIVEVDEAPVCPYCEKELEEIRVNTKQASLVESHNVYSCSHCKKVIGVAFARSVF